MIFLALSLFLLDFAPELFGSGVYVDYYTKNNTKTKGFNQSTKWKTLLTHVKK